VGVGVIPSIPYLSRGFVPIGQRTASSCRIQPSSASQASSRTPCRRRIPTCHRRRAHQRGLPSRGLRTRASHGPPRGSGAATPVVRFARLFIGAAAFLADLRSAPPAAAIDADRIATYGGRAGAPPTRMPGSHHQRTGHPTIPALPAPSSSPAAVPVGPVFLDSQSTQTQPDAAPATGPLGRFADVAPVAGGL
jgi:hypothetical protein